VRRQPTRCALKVLVIVMAAGLGSCDEPTPTSPSPPDVAGRWEGAYVITACTPSEALCSNSCRAALGQRSTGRLTLQQVTTSLSGALELYLDDPFYRRSGSLGGQVSSAGAVSLAGTIPEVDRETGRISRYFDLTWSTVASGNAMTGSFVYATRNASGTGCTTTETATLVLTCTN
jgi:hypothetical protein